MPKIETHLHTAMVSKCGRLSAEEIVRGYREAGYKAICVTDHYNRTTFDFLGVDLNGSEDKMFRFLDGYRQVKAEAEKYGIYVIKGAELRFDESDNDYLLYGYTDDLLSDPEKIFQMGIVEFSKIARSRGALLIQAHPYRRHCTPAIACYLDGVEVCNLNPRHDSHNDRAEEYAAEYGLIRTGGSDCHRPEDIARGGILADSVPSDDFGMMRLLRSRNFKIIGADVTE